MNDPLQIMQLAVGDHIKAFADEIGRDKSQVYRWLGDPELDPLTRMVATLEAAFAVNPEGEELLFQYIQARHVSLREEAVMRGARWEDALGDAMATTADCLAEAVKRGPELEAKGARAIRAIQYLLAQRQVELRK